MNLKIRKLVKNNIKQTLRLVVGVLLLAVVFSACNESNDLGIEILPGEDLINVKNTVIKDDILAFTVSEDELISSGGTSLLGSFNDPVFGRTDVNFAAQFRITSFPDYGTNPVADSIKLFLYYRSVYGDTITPQNFKVYELELGLDEDADYTQDIDLKSMAYDNLLGEVDYTPTIRIDSTTLDTLYELITIPLDNSLGEKLVNADSMDLISNDVFLEYFKGLFVETEQITDAVGSLINLDAAANSSFQGSALVVYYNNDENIAEGEDADTLSRAFIITENSARVNSIVHDYSGTPVEPNLDNQVVQAENIYVQPTGGLKSLILIDGLENWKDSVNTGINKAELVFQVDTIATDMENFAPPSQLLITFIDDEGNEKLPKDYYFNPNFYSGFLYEGYTYRFNITQHLQAIIDGEVGNNGFYLSTGRKTYYANRVILEGTPKDSGIKFSITYSKFMQ